MRSLLMLAALSSPLALAQSLIDVQSHALLRLPAATSVLRVERLHVADHGTFGVLQGSCRVSRVFKLLFSAPAAPALG